MSKTNDFENAAFSKLSESGYIELLEGLDPVLKGNKFELTCPACNGKKEGFIYLGTDVIQCNRKKECGKITKIIPYLVGSAGTAKFYEVVKRIGSLTGIEYSESLEAKAYNSAAINKHNILNEILNYGLKQYEKENNKGLKYWEERGYDKSRVLRSNTAFIPSVSELEAHLKSNGYDTTNVNFHTFENYPILIPNKDRYGNIRYFSPRSLNRQAGAKVKFESGIKRYFHNIENATRTEDVILVEGEIDALTATIEGMKGVVATGGSVNAAKVNELLECNKILKNVIICFDSDPAGIKEAKAALNLFNSINNDRRINIYIATLPEEGTDPDAFILNYGIDSFKKVIKEADYVSTWKIKQAINDAPPTNAKNNDALIQTVSEILNVCKEKETRVNIDYLKTVPNFPLIDLVENIKNYGAKQAELKQAEEAASLIQSLNDKAKDGDYLGALTIYEGSIKRIKAITGNKFSSPLNVDDAIKELKESQGALNYGYDKLQKIAPIPVGAITLIAGRPTHGKTTFMYNMFLNMIELYPTKRFYYYSYEESKTALFVKMLTRISGTVLDSARNSAAVESYLKQGRTNGAAAKYDAIDKGLSKIRSYITEERLNLYNEFLTVEEIAGTLEDYSNNYDNVGAIFIDYAQRIKTSGTYKDERLKVGAISEILRESATKFNVPLIIGAQLNRDNAGEPPRLENLKEAGHLEEDANLVLGLHNWKAATTSAQKNNGELIVNVEVKINGKKETKTYNIANDNTDIEIHILKNRNGEVNKKIETKYDATILNITEK